MPQFTALEGQSIYDVLLQVYGGLDNIKTLCNASGVDDLNQTNFKGKQFTFELSKVNDRSLVNNIGKPSNVYISSINSNSPVPPATQLGAYSLAYSNSYDNT